MRSFIILAAIGCMTFLNSTVIAQSSTQSPGANQTGAASQQPAASNQNITPRAGQPPQWYSTLTNEHNQFLEQLLDYWQKKSDAVKRYQCQFTRYDYNTEHCNWRSPVDNRLAAAAISQGEIRFASPDQAFYETKKAFTFGGPPEKEGQSAKYTPRENYQEKWICDGKAIHEYDFDDQKLYEITIPPEMQGKGLTNSPIPFLFGASKEDILNRYWVRIITPDGVENEYWLEAVPKRIDDARNYKKLDLVISRDELFLPIMLQIYSPNYDPKANNFESRVLEFNERKVNGALTGFRNFLGIFVRPSTPLGWERIKRLGVGGNQPINPNLSRPAQNTGTTQVK